MSRVRRDRNSDRKIWIFIFVVLCLFGLIFFHLIDAHPQLNFYYTDEIYGKNKDIFNYEIEVEKKEEQTSQK